MRKLSRRNLRPKIVMGYILNKKMQVLFPTINYPITEKTLKTQIFNQEMAKSHLYLLICL